VFLFVELIFYKNYFCSVIISLKVARLLTGKQDRKYTYYVILWRVRLVFLRPQLINFRWQKPLYGDLMAPATMKHTQFFTQSAPYLCASLTRFEIAKQNLIKVPLDTLRIRADHKV
jgi:hypothetical protein